MPTSQATNSKILRNRNRQNSKKIAQSMPKLFQNNFHNHNGSRKNENKIQILPFGGHTQSGQGIKPQCILKTISSSILQASRAAVKHANWPIVTRSPKRDDKHPNITI